MMTRMAIGTDEAREVNGGRRFAIETEQAWRRCDTVYDEHHRARLAVGHWLGDASANRPLVAPVQQAHYTIDVLSERTSLTYSRDGSLVYSGPAEVGAIQVSAPRSEVRCTFVRPTPAIHIYVPEQAVEKLYEDFADRGFCTALTLKDPAYTPLGNVGTLALALADVSTLSGPVALLWLETLTLAIMVRVLNLEGGSPRARSGSGGLTHWRQRRAFEFIDANLAESISLTDIASHVGLSRMHFASQFKISTGFSPHIYVLNRRLTKAKQLLSSGNASVLDIAFEVGFRSQSHFCVAFKRFAGVTPTEWRTRRGGPLSLNLPCDSSGEFDDRRVLERAELGVS